MDQNSDITNIFNSYRNNVVLNEALENNVMGNVINSISGLKQLLNDPNIDQSSKKTIQDLISNVENASKTVSTPQQPQQAAQPAAPTQQRAQNPYTTDYKGVSIVDFLGKSGQASDFKSRQALAQRMGIQDYKGTAEQNTQMLQSLQKQAQDFQKMDQAAQQPQTSTPAPQQPITTPGGITIGNPSGSATPVVPVPQTSVATTGDSQTTQAQTQQPPTTQEQPATARKRRGKNNTSPVNIAQQTTPEEKSEAEEEKSKKFEHFGLNKNTVEEKNNISKFLKHLSEKNYSSAHKYLKAIVSSKINKIVSERIEKI